MEIAFTICSNNYLAHAKTLADSFHKFHPDVKFIIGLVDKYDPTFEYSFFENAEIILVEELNMLEFDELQRKFDITELNTSVKPAYFHHLFKKYNADKVIYIDPDILVTSRFDEVLMLLDTKNMIITPHLTEPIEDEFGPNDYHILRGGVFNLGFIGLSNYSVVKKFLDWWHLRVVKYGYRNDQLGMFYDQVWINYVPAFYDFYSILKHPGYNMAAWNLHERRLSAINDNFVVNNEFPLRFYHFSSYRFSKPDVICTYLSRYDFNNRPDLKPIFDLYRSLLIANNIEKIQNLKLYYSPPKLIQTEKKTLIKKISNRVKRSVEVLIRG